MKARALDPGPTETVNLVDHSNTEAPTLEDYRQELVTVARDHGQECARRDDPDAFDAAIAAIRDAAELGSFSAERCRLPSFPSSARFGVLVPAEVRRARVHRLRDLAPACETRRLVQAVEGVMSEPPPFFIGMTAALMDRRLTGTDVRVLCALSSFYNRKTGACWPSKSSIQERSGMGRTVVSDSLRHLRDAGYVNYWKSATKAGNEYEILYPEVEYEGVGPPDTPRSGCATRG